MHGKPRILSQVWEVADTRQRWSPSFADRARVQAACETASLRSCGHGGAGDRGSAIRGDEEVSMTDLDQVAPPSAPRDRQTVDLQWYRRELEQQRRFRLDQLTDLAYEGLAASGDALSEVTAALMRAARAALADIDAALFRLAIGRFGVCQRCGRVIPADRLQAIPMASLCLRCQLSKESENPHVHPWRTGTIRPTAPPRPLRDIVEVWGEDSFPASDPPANW
jgi:RNA polymerase-binding transcription factor DksA